MSTTTIRQPNQTSPSRPKPPSSSGRWIINSWLDAVLFLWTPLLLAPLMLFLRSPYVGIEAETISLIVVAFGSLGHHFPGMIRAYGDRDLFQRFRMRFILAPVVLFAVFFPLYYYHYSAMQLVLMIWASWHALMQIYGFVRIYDAKVGCISPVTAYWDWLMCLSWCSTAQVFSHEKMSILLEHWYKFGGPLIPPHYVHALRWICLAGSLGVLIGFLVNHVRQTYQGPPPNSAKLMMLASGIGFWWICMVGVKNIVLGVALFEVFHDVQYLAIVWLYNCRRVNSNSDIGTFMKFVFRRGTLLLYIGLVLAYGLMGLVPYFAKDETLKTTFMAILWTSTILHYYFDGFIWKVREKSTRVSLGLNTGENPSRVARWTWPEFNHALKWSPFVVLLSWLFLTDLSGSSSLLKRRQDEISQKYTQALSGSSVLPQGEDERAWLYGQYEQILNIAAADPGDLDAQVRAAIMLANFGRNDEAIESLQKLLEHHPSFTRAHQLLGQIYLYRGNVDQAFQCFQTAFSCATTIEQRSKLNLNLGEVYLQQGELELANIKFQEARKDNPELEAAIDPLRSRMEGRKKSR